MAQSRKNFVQACAAIVVSVVLNGAAWAQNFVATDTQSVMQSINDYRAEHETEIIKDFAALLSLPNVATNLSDM
ncbi:MAG: hypothetical protein HOM16_12950, partial [Woeseia sp.]|nr:hypothetical protein [Woeseia sp.]